MSASDGFSRVLGAQPVRWLGMLGLCAAYLQGGVNKALDFGAAVAEMQHFGLAPAVPFAATTILLEIVASMAILLGTWRWLASLSLAVFTLAAMFLANRFWEMAGAERAMAANGFFEHLGLVGGFVLIAWLDVHERVASEKLR